MKKIHFIYLAVLIVTIVVTIGYQVHAGAVSVAGPTQTAKFVTYDFFASSTDAAVIATTTSAVSTSVVPGYTSEGIYDDGTLLIAGAKRVTFYFGRGDTVGTGNSGSSLFTVEVTPNGTDWYNYNKLIQNTATSSVPTSLSSITIAAATSTVITSLDTANFGFLKARCRVVETTDGEHRCRATAEF